MKTKLIALAVASTMLTACMGTNPPKADSAPTRALTQNESTVNTMPLWFSNGTPATAEYMYTAGTAVSKDLSMSVQKATLDAQAKVAEFIRADVDSYTKSHKQDVNGAYTENTEILVRKLVNEIQLSRGTVTQKVVQAENGGFRTYVQIRYSAPNIERAIAATGTYNGPTARELKLEADLDQRKADQRKVPQSAAVVKPIADGGIVIRGTEASPNSAPLNLDSKEEN
jgi:hypothetical protein